MPQATRSKSPRRRSPPTAEDRATSRIIAAFICAAGVGVIAMAIATVRAKWIGDSALQWRDLLYLLLAGLAALSAWSFFRALNPETPTEQAQGFGDAEARRYFEEQVWPGRRKRFRTAAVGAAAAGGLLFVLVATLTRQHPRYDQFALTIPTRTSTAAAAAAANPQVRVSRTTSSAQDTDGKSSRQSSEEVTEQSYVDGPNRDAVLVWWVKRPPPKTSSGLLPMALGGLFLCVFGAVFPHIKISAASSSMGLVEKLVAPILSLALVGIGASQQVAADRAEKDLQLAEKGLPAVLALDQPQVARREALAREHEVRVLEREQLSPEAVDRLQDSISVLSQTLRQAGGDVDTRGQLEGTRNDLLRLQIQLDRATAHTPPPDRNLQRVADAADNLQRRYGAELDAETGRRAIVAQRECALMDVEEQQTALRIRELRTVAARKQAEWATWEKRGALRFVYPKPEDGTAEKALATELERAANENRTSRLKAFCPPKADTQTASN